MNGYLKQVSVKFQVKERKKQLFMPPADLFDKICLFMYLRRPIIAENSQIFKAL